MMQLSSKGVLKSERSSTATVGSVARRFQKEIGLPKPLSVRLSKKFNELAKKVDWAVSLPEREIPSYARTKHAKKSARRRSK
jgi:hypothetical protein